MSTDTNGRHKRVKKRKVDKEFSYEESDSKSSAYVDGDQEITENNKNTTEKNTQNKKNGQKNKENQIPKQKNTSKKNKKESQDKANSFIGAECLAQMKNQLASPAPVLMQHPNFGCCMRIFLLGMAKLSQKELNFHVCIFANIFRKCIKPKNVQIFFIQS